MSLSDVVCLVYDCSENSIREEIKTEDDFTNSLSWEFGSPGDQIDSSRHSLWELEDLPIKHTIL